jgi:hypothetical protein
MITHHTPLTLFIVKRFHTYDQTACHPVSNGLTTSAQIIVDMLLAEGQRAKLVEAIDGNCIDRLVNENRPARVVIEAIWVTPAKFAELKKLWPKVRWTVRVHSEIPFLASEGMAIDWLYQYAGQGIEIAFNSAQAAHDANVIFTSAYLPNYYPLRKPRPCRPDDPVVDVGCFGAIRPLKNQLMQAFAAVRYARIRGKKLRFHMNSTRQEQGGNNNLKNIIALSKAARFELVLHNWLEHEEFLELIGAMDIVLQVSLTETFCLTAADAVSMGVPLVGSSAIPWLPRFSQADPDSAQSIVDAMNRENRIVVWINRESLENYLKHVVKEWNEWLSN